MAQGGHLISPVHTRNGEQQRYTCADCHATGPFDTFDVIGQDEFCPERLTSMNGRLWFNADDPSVARQRASHQWYAHAKRYGYAIENYRLDPETPGICGRFTWREQEYVLRYGRDSERGMKVNDLRVELADQKPEPTGA
jgi:hypothetical protein